MKVYFDSCAIQRPLDKVDQVRIALEIEALLGVFELVESGAIDLISSEVLELELERIPISVRRRHALNLLVQAAEVVMVTDLIEQRAKDFVSLHLKPFDALHLACAESVEADYFCTCDERLLRRSKLIQGLRTTVVSPLELAEELNL
jgi:predicted nucleic acid-binding protein